MKQPLRTIRSYIGATAHEFFCAHSVATPGYTRVWHSCGARPPAASKRWAAHRLRKRRLVCRGDWDYAMSPAANARARKNAIRWLNRVTDWSNGSRGLNWALSFQISTCCEDALDGESAMLLALANPLLSDENLAYLTASVLMQAGVTWYEYATTQPPSAQVGAYSSGVNPARVHHAQTWVRKCFALIAAHPNAGPQTVSAVVVGAWSGPGSLPDEARTCSDQIDSGLAETCFAVVGSVPNDKLLEVADLLLVEST